MLGLDVRVLGRSTALNTRRFNRCDISTDDGSVFSYSP